MLANTFKIHCMYMCVPFPLKSLTIFSIIFSLLRKKIRQIGFCYCDLTNFFDFAKKFVKLGFALLI